MNILRNKITILLLLFLGSGSTGVKGQFWTWLHGPNTNNGNGVFGVQGVPAPTNIPPSLYSCAEWTDLQGNLWIFGGMDRNIEFWAALWKYDITTNQWTWVHGPNTVSQAGVYGTQGVPSPANRPGSRGLGTASWTDNNGDLWMLGGDAYDMNGAQGSMNDLWKYNIATNQWTWVRGGNTVAATGSYGTFQVPSPANDPPPRKETAVGFATSTNQLWLFGGITPGGLQIDDVWRYDIATNVWTWMQGSNTAGAAASYGTMGVPNVTNTPGARMVFTRWVDHNNNFWIFGGHTYGTVQVNLSDLWRYNTTTNEWTWIHGPQGSQVPGVFGTQCIPDAANNPPARYQARSSWVDGCDRLWLFGGHNNITSGSTRSDLWVYDIWSDTWTWVDGPQAAAVPAVFGTQGVPAAANNPPGLAGAATSIDKVNGILYVFGGIDFWVNSFRQNVWSYKIDSLCPDNGTPPPVTADIISPDSVGCVPFTANFTNGSSTTLFLEWDFGDSSPTTNMANPSHQYTTPGVYTVSLIALDSNTCGKSLDTAYFQVTVADTIPLSLGSDTTICPGTTILLSAGIGSGTFEWSGGQTTATINAGAGTWWVNVDYGTCSFTDTIVVSQFNILPTTINPVTDQCFNGHSYDFSLTGVTDPLATYSWSFLPDGNPSSSTSPTVNGVTFATPGPKTIISSLSQFGCNGLNDTVTVFIYPPVVGTFTSGSTSGCAPLIVNFSADDTIPGHTYFWDFGNGTTSTTGNPSAVFPDSGNFTVTLLVYDSLCNDSAFSTINVNVLAGVTAIFRADPFPEVNAGVFVTFIDSSQGNVVSWQWSFGDGDSILLQNPDHSYLEPGFYPVTLIVTSDSGCVDDTTLMISVIQDLLIPNVFTPNGDGINDVYVVTGFSQYELLVYDRWGQKIFNNGGVRTAYWDGNTAGGNKAPEGVYYVHISGMTYEGKRMDQAFDITLLR